MAGANISRETVQLEEKILVSPNVQLSCVCVKKKTLKYYRFRPRWGIFLHPAILYSSKLRPKSFSSVCKELFETADLKGEALPSNGREILFHY